MLILIGRGLDLKRGENAKERRGSVRVNPAGKHSRASKFEVSFSCVVFRARALKERTNELNTISGDNGKRDPPVPIPNTEVKPLRADGTWLATARESRSSPDSKGADERSSAPIILSSSMAEHSAVNRRVVGSSPT